MIDDAATEKMLRDAAAVERFGERMPDAVRRLCQHVRGLIDERKAMQERVVDLERQLAAANDRINEMIDALQS